MLLCILTFLGCSEQEKEEESVDGATLIENYNSAYCSLLSDPECVEGFAECGEQMTLFSDWAQCMNSQNLVTGDSCVHLAGVFEENTEMVLACTEMLENQQCADNLCTSEGTIIQTAECGDVIALIVQNCSLF